MKPSSKKLILGLLLAAEGRPITVREVIHACGLFEITENNVRVTLVRLSAEGLIQASGRGAYVMAYIGNLGRSDRKALKQRERALEMLGMKALERGLYVRPDNLDGGVDAVRKRLLSLGLESAAVTFVASDFDKARLQKIAGLWDTQTLDQRYISQSKRLVDWLESYTELESDVAARESYLMGGQAIRQVVFDPLLPPPFVNTDARHEFIETVNRFDETGKAIWEHLSQINEAMPAKAATTHLTSGVLQ